MSSINRPLAGPMLTFDLAQQLDEVRREDAFARSGRAARTLAKAGRFRLVLIAMAEGNVIHTHQADSPLTIHLLEGDITYRAEDGEHELSEGQVLFFSAGDAHDITARRQSALLLTLSAEGDDFGTDVH